MTLSAEQRRKVAEHVTGYECVLDENRVIVKYADDAWLWWRPDVELPQKDALARKVAQLLCHERVQSTDTLRLKNKLVHALADNDVNAIEQLCYELLGDNDG